MSTVGRRRQEKPIATRKLGDIAGVCDHCVTGMGVAVEAEGFEIEGSGHAPDTASQIVKERAPGTSSFCHPTYAERGMGAVTPNITTDTIGS